MDTPHDLRPVPNVISETAMVITELAANLNERALRAAPPGEPS
jgi:hypothetical protein